MTTISAVMRRPYSQDLFDDLDLPAHVRSYSAATDVTTLTFDSPLTGPQAAAVLARIDATDDADQERRAQLRADREPLGPNDPQRRIIDYLLGDST
jgi:hypothetical protein